VVITGYIGSNLSSLLMWHFIHYVGPFSNAQNSNHFLHNLPILRAPFLHQLCLVSASRFPTSGVWPTKSLKHPPNHDLTRHLSQQSVIPMELLEVQNREKYDIDTAVPRPPERLGPTLLSLFEQKGRKWKLLT
jgi:hypothetical protein